MKDQSFKAPFLTFAIKKAEKFHPLNVFEAQDESTNGGPHILYLII